MKKRMIAMVVICAFAVLGLSQDAFSQVTKTGGASVVVPQFMEFSMADVYKMESADGADADPWTDGVKITGTPSFDFGELSAQTDDGTSTGRFLYMKGTYYYYVMMIASTSGRQYYVSSSGTGFTGIENAIVLVPDYQWLDELTEDVPQGAPPTGSRVGTAVSVVGASHLVYQSGSAGLGRLVRAVVGILGPLEGEKLPFSCYSGHNGETEQGARLSFTNWKPVTKDTPGGSYSGTISFTLTLGSY